VKMAEGLRIVGEVFGHELQVDVGGGLTQTEERSGRFSLPVEKIPPESRAIRK
jgi:hypothetical protein